MKHQGEVLRYFVALDERPKSEISALLGILPTYLSRLFQKKKLTDHLIEKSCSIFSVDPSVFIGEDIPFEKKGINGKKSVIDYEDRITELEESIKSLAAELEREKAMTDTMRKALEKYFNTET